ncbi:MAG: Fic family protein [Patescibacteria group bacterium]
MSNILAHKFPPDLSNIYDEELANQLAQTQGWIGSLKQTPRLLTNASLLMRPILGKEAEASSQLEGTQASIDDVFKMGIIGQTSEKKHEALEILNYEKAMLEGIEILKKFDLNNFLIRSIHKTLLRGARGKSKNPGEFRKKAVWIGQSGTGKGEARYVPPDPVHVEQLMENLEKFIATSNHMNPLIVAGVIHHRFEAIHPFEDGNGRVGRLLITLYLIKRELLEIPILYPSGYFEKHKRYYMSALSKVDKKQDWRSWMLFFLKGLEEQAKVSLKLSTKIDELFKRSKAKIETETAGLGLIKALEATFSRPYITAPILSKMTGIPRPTCVRYLNKLAEKRIINDRGIQIKQRIYANDKLRSILNKI